MSKPKIRMIKKVERPEISKCKECPFVRAIPGKAEIGHCYGFPPHPVQGKENLLIVSAEVNMEAPSCIIPVIHEHIMSLKKKEAPREDRYSAIDLHGIKMGIVPARAGKPGAKNG